MTSWVFLFAAILLEVAGTTCLKLSAGFPRAGPIILMFVFYGFSLAALALAVARIEIGVAYAVWAGLGTALIAVVGILYFREAVTLGKLVSIMLIVVGVAGLHLPGSR